MSGVSTRLVSSYRRIALIKQYLEHATAPNGSAPAIYVQLDGRAGSSGIGLPHTIQQFGATSIPFMMLFFSIGLSLRVVEPAYFTFAFEQ